MEVTNFAIQPETEIGRQYKGCGNAVLAVASDGTALALLPIREDLTEQAAIVAAEQKFPGAARYIAGGTSSYEFSSLWWDGDANAPYDPEQD